MLKRIRTALFKHLLPVAYLALVFGACVVNAPVAIAFFSFFAPLQAFASLVLVVMAAGAALAKRLTPDEFRAQFAKEAAEVRGKSLLSRVYGAAYAAAMLAVLIIGLHPVYAFFYLVGVASVYAIRALLLDV